MYYFKVPVFTKLSRIQNIVFLSLQLVIFITSVLISLYRGCYYESITFIDGCNEFNIIPGNTMVTNRTHSSWEFTNLKKYSSELITDIYKIEYYNILNTNTNGHEYFKGNIILFENENVNYDAVFRNILKHTAYYEFYIYFNKTIDMNKEIYNITINDGYLELNFLNSCKNNTVLLESDGSCIIKNGTYNKINNFLNDYFIEEFIVPYKCNNCYKNGIKSFNEIITILSKIISIFVMLNSILVILYMFIISKIKKSDIGFIKNFIDINISRYNNISKNNINEININEVIKN